MTYIESLQEWAPMYLFILLVMGTLTIVAYGKEAHAKRLEKIAISRDDLEYIKTEMMIGPICRHDYENYIEVSHYTCGFIMRQRLDSEIIGEGTFR